ncbi:hypothetical protein Vau01_114180 [Virgisporangium aurantiacum]|uniref:Uncharacterized protein n=2 Tax=Virgisporangium aurantiacum TaxID=175570 RepID=A0A8J3ZGW2_9ACTN|nr:hypothetical protein Vau01_114180 [Virgisporangium aurantiacum]
MVEAKLVALGITQSYGTAINHTENQAGPSRDRRAPILSEAELVEACRLQLDQAMKGVRDKYISNLYVDRPAIAAEFDAFIAQRERNTLLFLGEAGTGKTNLLCHLANNLADHAPVLFYRGAELRVERFAVHKAIAADLSALTGKILGPDVLREIGALASVETPLTVFIDAANEANDLPLFSEVLGQLVESAGRNSIRFCISCRSADWRFFKSNVNIMTNLYAPSTHLQLQEGLLVSRFSPAELSQAWPRYAEWFDIRGELTDEAGTICSHPVMLRLACESFRGRELPELRRARQVFDAYWQEKIEDSRRSNLSGRLFELVLSMRESKSDSLPEEQVAEILGEDEYSILLSEGVILYVKVEELSGIRVVGFTYETFLEYVTARAILLREKWSQLNITDILGSLQGLMTESASYRTLVGVIEFVLLRFEGQLDVLETLVQMLICRETPWRTLACTVISKLDSTDDRIVNLLRTLSTDSEYWVRWLAAFAISQLLRLHPESETLLEDWASDGSPATREAAANAIGHLGTTPRTISILHALADDGHWRVRRAVSYSLNRLFSDSKLTLGVLDRWVTDASWKVRDVILPSQLNLSVDPLKSISILEVLADDIDEQVRWSTAKYVVTVPAPEERVTAVLGRLAYSDSHWIRKRVVTSLSEIAWLGRSEVAILERMSADINPWIRWEVARAATHARFVIERDRVRILDRLLVDSDADVRAAAQYSADLLDGRVPNDLVVALEVISPDELTSLRETVARVRDLVWRPDNDSAVYRSWKVDHYINFVTAITLVFREKIFDQAAVRKFVLLLINDAEEGVRWATTQVLPGLPLSRSDVNELLCGACHDPVKWVRRSAIEIVSDLPGALSNSLTNELERLTDDPAPEVRAAVAQTIRLCRMESSVAGVRILERLRADKEVDVRLAAT